MRRKPRPAQEAGRPPPMHPPRVALAVAAAAMAVVVHAAVFGLFDRQARQEVQLASMVGERALAACRRDPDRARQRACLNAALAQARSGAAVALAPAIEVRPPIVDNR